MVLGLEEDLKAAFYGARFERSCPRLFTERGLEEDLPAALKVRG